MMITFTYGNHDVTLLLPKQQSEDTLHGLPYLCDRCICFTCAGACVLIPLTRDTFGCSVVTTPHLFC